MTNLEFIEKEIERYKIIIYGVKTMLKEPHRTEDTITFLKNDLKEYEEKINHLQSIKNELEAWETVKPSIHHIKEQQCFVIHNMFQKNQYNAIKKGLKI